MKALRARLFLLLCGVAGCQTAPPAVPAPAPKPPPTIRLCGREMPAEAAAVEAEVLRQVAPGLPLEDAHARMQELGFRCLYAGALVKKPKRYHPRLGLFQALGAYGPKEAIDKRFHSLVCTLSANEAGNWGERYFPVTVSLPYDEGGRLTEVEVTLGRPQPSRYAHFFARRPELREPVGLPAEQARAVMEAHQFHCAYHPPDEKDGRRQPYLDCYAYDEAPLGGNVVRAHLFYGPDGVVTEAEVVQRPGEWDDLRCMLPNDSDTVAGGLVKTVVFPVRLYAAIVVAGLAADIALARP